MDEKQASDNETSTIEGAICSRCGGWSRDRSECDRCGAQLSGSNGLGVTMVFTNPVCESCGEICIDSVCIECGQRFDGDTPEDEVRRAREAALAPLLARIQDVVESFDRMPAPHLSVTVDQFMRAFGDLDIFAQAREIPSYFQGDQAELRLASPREIGRRGRRSVEGFIERCEYLRDRVAELCWCDVPAEAAPVREATVRVARGVVVIAQRLLEVATAPTVAEAGVRATELQTALDSVPSSDLGDAIAALDAEAMSTTHERISRAFGISGNFVNPDGSVEIAEIYTALTKGRDDNPIAANALAAMDLVKHLAMDPEAGSSTAAMLIDPLVRLAAHDNPVRAHKISHHLLTSLRAAWTKNEAATRDAIERVASNSRRNLASAARLARRFDALGDVPVASADVELLVECYRLAAEGAFRTYARLALDLSVILKGRQLSDQEVSTLGPIADHFRSDRGELARLVLDALDVELRNAAAHEEYESEPGLVRLLSVDRVIDVEDLNHLNVILQLATQGMDLALMAFVIEHDLGEAIDWQIAGIATYEDIVISNLFAMKGYRLREVHRGPSVTFIIDDANVESRSDLLTPVMSCRAHFPNAAEFIVRRSADEDLLVRVPRVAIEAYYAYERPETGMHLLSLSVAALVASEGPERLDRETSANVAALGIKLLTESVENLGGDRAEALTFIRAEAATVQVVLRQHCDKSAIPQTVQGSLGAVCNAPSIDAAAHHLRRLAQWQEARALDWPLF